jgi:hypothetical protein
VTGSSLAGDALGVQRRLVVLSGQQDEAVEVEDGGVLLVTPFALWCFVPEN